MSTTTNTVVLFKEDPGRGWVEEKHMEVTKQDFNADAVELKEGEVLLKIKYLSLDPYMRGRMQTKAKSYSAPFEIGKPLQAGGIGEVYRVGKGTTLKTGDLVLGFVEWAQWFVAAEKGLKKLEIFDGVPISYNLGVLGMPGITAYGGLMKIGEPKEGETVYVSGAAGAVGLLVGQLARLRGCRVVGSAGTDDKVKVLLEEAGYDAAFNYKTVKSLDAAFKEHCPKGIDIYFDNVGGEMLDVALTHMNVHSRIPVCGAISQYNASEQYGVKNLMQTVIKRIKIQGFLSTDLYGDQELVKNFTKDVVALVKEGKIVYKEHIVEGIENAPSAFVGLLKGANTGKQIIKVA
ncbi:hypothetical protein PhCBS80983_g05194 [Powellomyces hirtus]|uniref:Enoyl reductase (ER) domain-containing protein n=1 Tax=Powellomyces hirtus TaxID=109895 RepID=A0A507DV07_9FUNG|nr:hypothetical protein PhCBS80983_g05194 [Powellomyces hirtus]